MNTCNNCNKTFAEPFSNDDDVNDETYELCPYCFSDNIELNDEIK